MEFNARLAPKQIIAYARHGFVEINFAERELVNNYWDNSTIDTRDLNAIAEPVCYWKRGAIHFGKIENPRLYVASRVMWDERRLEQLPQDAQHFVPLQVLEGFRIRTKDISEFMCFWNVEPIYK